jgi:hypothetical protein
MAICADVTVNIKYVLIRLSLASNPQDPTLNSYNIRLLHKTACKDNNDDAKYGCTILVIHILWTQGFHPSEYILTGKIKTNNTEIQTRHNLSDSL